MKFCFRIIHRINYGSLCYYNNTYCVHFCSRAVLQWSSDEAINSITILYIILYSTLRSYIYDEIYTTFTHTHTLHKSGQVEWYIVVVVVICDVICSSQHTIRASGCG